MSCADAIGSLLGDAHFTSYFTKVCPSALVCAEPIVILEGPFARDSRMRDEERGTVSVTVLVVREVAAKAAEVAYTCECAVRRGMWEPYADAGEYRLVGIDTTAPVFKECDASGRFVWSFEVTCTVVRCV